MRRKGNYVKFVNTPQWLVTLPRSSSDGVGCSVLFLDTPRANSGRDIAAVSLNIAFTGAVLLLLLLSLVWGLVSPASSALVLFSSFGGEAVVILRSEV